MFTKKQTCKGCRFSKLTSCEYGVNVEVMFEGANIPLEPCHKVTTQAQEKRFHELRMDEVFRADLEIYRAL